MVNGRNETILVFYEFGSSQETIALGLGQTRTSKRIETSDRSVRGSLPWLRFWIWGILCLYRWKRLINNSNVKLLNTPVTEQIVLILFRSINELQRTETSSLLKLVMDSSSGSGSNNGSGTLAEKIVKIGIELLPRNMTILSTENEFRSDRTWLFSGEGLVEGQNTINLYNDWSEGVISPPEFLWKMLAQNDLFNLG